MNPKEWIKSFELINGRKPTSSEIKNAIHDGNSINQTLKKRHQTSSWLVKVTFSISTFLGVCFLLYVGYHTSSKINQQTYNSPINKSNDDSVFNDTDISEEDSNSASDEESNDSVEYDSSSSSPEVIHNDEQDDIEYQLNRFIQEYVKAVDKSVASQTDYISQYFQDKANDNYIKAIDEIYSGTYKKYITHNSSISDIKKNNSIYTCTSTFNRELIFANKGSETVYYKRIWKVKEVSKNKFYIESFETLNQ